MSTTEHMQKNKTIFDRLFFIYSTLVFFESLLGIGTSLGDLQDVEADSFAEWSTFTYSHNVSHLHVPEAWTKVHRHVSMPLLESLVLFNVVQVVASDHNCSLHFHFLDNTCQNASTDGHVPKWRNRTCFGEVSIMCGSWKLLRGTSDVQNIIFQI